jgi:hypothetical protein
VERVVAPEGVTARVKAFVPARLVDVSLRGAQVEVAVSLQPRQSCALRLRIGGDELTLPSTVRRSRVVGFGVDEKSQTTTVYRAGLEFEPTEDAVHERLARFLAAHPAVLDDVASDLGLPAIVFEAEGGAAPG